MSFHNEDISLSDHQYSTMWSSISFEQQLSCSSCQTKDALIKSLGRKINHLNKEISMLKKDKLLKSQRPKFSAKDIKTDAKMNFYTGISTIFVFETIFSILTPYLPTLRYWRGKETSTKVKKRFIQQRKRMMSQKDEFLLVLMRLRLGLLNEDVADRFCVSAGVASNIFTTWIKMLSSVLGNVLIAWLPREPIRDHIPNIFKKTGHYKVRCIIDCSEVFIQRPKSMIFQAVTWSDYKSHNTFKFLIGISPSGFITFVSDCYGGRASDRFICMDNAEFTIDQVKVILKMHEETMLNFIKMTTERFENKVDELKSKHCPYQQRH